MKRLAPFFAGRRGYQKHSGLTDKGLSRKSGSERTALRAKRVVGIFVLLGALLGIASFSGSSTGTAQVGMAGIARSFASAWDISGEGSSLESGVSDWEASLVGEVSADFEAEVLSSEDKTFWVANDGSTVGFSFDGSAKEACEYMTTCLGEKGWTVIESGSDAVLTFAKGTGAYRWIGMSATEVGQTTSVVLVVRQEQ